MRTTGRVVLAVMVALGAVSQAGGADGDARAAAAFRDAAFEAYYTPSGRPGQALELVVLAEMAARLAPKDPQAHWLLAAVYEQQGRGVEADRTLEQTLAAEAWKVYLSARGDDYVARLRYLADRFALCNTLDEKIATVRDVVSDKTASPPVRAEAAVLLADLYASSGQSHAARDALLQAIALDGHHAAALQQWLAMQPRTRPVDRLDVYLRILRGGPFSVETAVAAATELDSQGLHAQAATFHEHAWKLLGQWDSRGAVPALADEYASALLAAGQAQAALAVLIDAPQDSKYPARQLLLADAYQAAGDKSSAAQHTNALYLLLDKSAQEDPSPAHMGEVAWYLVMAGRSGKAPVSYARKALDADPNNQTLQAILAAALANSGDPEAVKTAVQTLQDLAQKDAFAAMNLAEYYRSRGASAAARQAILSGLAQTRRGAVARRLERLAAAEKMNLGTTAQGRLMQELLKGFDARSLEYARRPEKFLSIELSAPETQVAIGQPLRVTAVLANGSDVSVPLGQWGAASNVDVRMPAIGLTARCFLGGQRTFSSRQLVPAIWPAGRWLAAGASVTTTTRVDLGPLRRGLSDRPFDDVEVTVSGAALPLLDTADDKSMLPTLGVGELTITRIGLLGAFDRKDPAAWRKALADLMARLQDAPGNRDLEQRLSAARQAGLLLAAGLAGPETLPEPLTAEPIVKQAAYVVGLLLHDTEPAVRAEMAASLSGCLGHPPVRDELIKLVNDSSIMVRVRVAQQLCRHDVTAAARFANDDERLVRWMAAGAAAGAGATTQPAPASAPAPATTSPAGF